jgi:hypothetical protein
MLADELDYVLGVDTHRDEHALAVVTAPTGALVAGTAADATARGYRELLRVADRYAPGRRAWAIEGSGSYGAGLSRLLASRGETCSRSAARRERSGGCVAKTTPSTLPEPRGLRSPARRLRCHARASGARPCAYCSSARRSAVDVRREALSQLRAVIVTAPDRLREELRGTAS